MRGAAEKLDWAPANAGRTGAATVWAATVGGRKLVGDPHEVQNAFSSGTVAPQERQGWEGLTSGLSSRVRSLRAMDGP